MKEARIQTEQPGSATDAPKAKRKYVRSGKYAKAAKPAESGAVALGGDLSAPKPKRKYTKAAASATHQGSSGVATTDTPSSAARAKLAGRKLAAAQLVLVDVSANEAFRPLTGFDVETFRARHKLGTSDMVHMLALQGSSQYNQVASRQTPLSFNHEFLVRICEVYPSPPPWTNISMGELFELMYSSIMQQFEPHDLVEMARVVLYYRFTALFGRSSFTGYRWVEKKGPARPELHKVAAKISERQNPRQAAEDIARIIWRVRGVDFDESFPLPTVAALTNGPHRGRMPGSASVRARRAVAQVRGAK